MRCWMMGITKEKNFVSAVVYVYNNENEVYSFLKSVASTLDKYFEKYEIICVNDCSSDNSTQIIEEFAKEITHSVITILNLSYYQGLEKAMHAGVDLSIGDFVFEFDSMVLDFDEDVIMDVYFTSLKGNDVVGAVADGPLKLSSKLFYTIYNKCSKNQNKLTSERFRILSRRGINRMQSMAHRLPYRKAIYANCGLKYITVKYSKRSTISINKLTEEQEHFRWTTATNTLILFTDIAYKFTVGLTWLMMLITFLVAMYTIWVFTTANPIAGWTTIMLILSFCFFGLFAVLSLIVKYLSIILDLVFNKQKYVVESVHKVTK